MIGSHSALYVIASRGYMFTITIAAVAMGIGIDPNLADHGITLREAKTLSVRELASRVLGQAGDTVIDVERPNDDRCGTTCPLSPTLDLDSKMQGMTFYTRAQPYTYNNILGLCRAEDDVVIYDKSGSVVDLSQRFKIGLVGQLTPMRAGYLPSEIIERVKQTKAAQHRCEDVKTTKDFAISPNYEDGALAFIAVDTVHNMINQQSDMSASCLIGNGKPHDCKYVKDLLPYLDDIRAANVTSVSTVYNRSKIAEIKGYPNAKCYSVGLSRSQIDARTVDICINPFGSNGVRVLSVRYSNGMLVF